jgi:hypothetical protein
LSNYVNETALFEHRFWLQVLGDHSRFILYALSPKESSEIQTAEQFILILIYTIAVMFGLKWQDEAIIDYAGVIVSHTNDSNDSVSIL